MMFVVYIGPMVRFYIATEVCLLKALLQEN